MRKEMRKEIKLKEGVKLVSFGTKGGVYVYQNKKLVGILTESRILKAMDA